AEVSRSIQFEVCDRPRAAPPTGAAWSQLGGAPSHAGVTPLVIAPPLAMVWAAPIGGHAMQGSPVVADGAVIVSATDLGDGNTGGAVALELATGALRWRVATPHQVRGGPAAAGQTVAVAQLEGTVLGLDVRSGAQRWQYELGAGLTPEAASLFASPAADDGELLIGNQRHFAAIDADSGAPSWTADPVPEGMYSQSLSAVAIGDGVVVGAFHRELGGVIAWDRLTGTELWRLRGGRATAINASPVIADGMVYVVNGLTEVFATEAATGTLRWTTKLHAEGFDWGNATVGTPAIADGVLVVPTMYGDLVGLDAATGAELWRTTGVPGPLRTTHYRGAGEAAFESSPVITGDVVWAADTSGRLSARELRSGRELWHTELGAPVLSGLAVAGDWLIVATYDGTVRAFAPATGPTPALPAPDACAVPDEPVPDGGCCNAGGADALPLAAVVALALRRRRRAQNVKIVAPQV
ncbi:MAG: outer membrane protein assembly factor BamB family protein, partial [Kofleriaceae bacterium]